MGYAMKFTKSVFCFSFGISWFVYSICKHHTVSWLIPGVFIIIGFYLKDQEN